MAASNTTDDTRLVVDDLGVRIKDFALDPSQDLIVLLEHRPAAGPSVNTSAATAGADIRVHLRKLSTGAVTTTPGEGARTVPPCAWPCAPCLHELEVHLVVHADDDVRGQ